MSASVLTAPENKAFYKEKSFSYGIAILFILFLSPKGVADAYLILGHAHFMMTALYQYKSGRITAPKFLIYLVAFYLLFEIAHAFPKPFTLFASAFLIVHVFSGEIRHFKRLFTLPYFLMTIAVMTLLCAWLSVQMWGVFIDIPLLILFLNILVIIACYSYYQARKDMTIDAFFPVMVLLYIAYVMLEYTGNRPVGFESFGFIVIAHYLSTYFNVFLSFRSKAPGKASVFVRESILMNMAFLAGFIIVFNYLGTENALYDYVYHPISFYVWTVMHFLTTWNNQEFAHIFRKANA